MDEALLDVIGIEFKGVAMIKMNKTLENLSLVRMMRRKKYDKDFKDNRDNNLFRGLYPSFAAAEAALPGGDRRGYDQPEAAAMYRGMLGSIRDHDYPVLYWLSRITTPLRSVFDYGGHIGLLYYAMHEHLTLSADFRWVVKDVPAVNASGRSMASVKKAKHLEFADDIEAASACQVFLASGSLQYVEANLTQLLDGLTTCPRHLILNLTPLDMHGGFFTVNSIGTAFCPYKVSSYQEFLSSLEQRGWEVIDTWKNPGKFCHVPFQTSHPDTEYYGFYLRR